MTSAHDTTIELQLDRLWAVLHAPSHVLARNRWQTLLLGEARALSTSLEQHFAREEEGGYFAELLVGRAHLASKFDELLADHAKIRSGLKAIDDLAESGAPLEELKRALVDVVARASRHEARELDLVQEASLRDLGVGD